VNDYDRGDTVRLDVEFKDIDAVLTDPTNVTVYVLDPSGNETVYNDAVNDAVGVYHKDVLLDEEGVWHYRWVGTGTLAAAGTGQLRVRKDVFS
jgi:uncharacterized protein YfaS (alpha-2-macroglobulin family)